MMVREGNPVDAWSDDDPCPDDVETALLLAWDDRLGDCPDEAVIAGWTPEQRREAFAWATGEHPAASDNDAVRSTVPEFLKMGGGP